MTREKASARPSSRPRLYFALCLAGLLVTLLGAVALVANYRAHTRGIPEGMPQPALGADIPTFCINAPLAQYEDDGLSWALDLMADGGFVWVRQNFPWSRIEPTPGGYEWETWDRIVEGASARDLRLVAVLNRAPDWAGAPPPAPDFARFAGAFAARYGDRIDYYQIWSNPNLADGWGADADPAAYAQMLQRAAEAIREADSTSTTATGPEAVILLGSLAPTAELGPENLSEVRFLRGLYAAGAGPYFDVLSVQPYGFDSGPYDRRVDEGELNFSRAILLREEMVAQGDGDKAVWASHFGWNSLPPEWDDVDSIWGTVDEETQAAYTVAAVERARREWPWMGAMCLSHFQPNSEAAAPSSGVPDAEQHWGFAAVGPEGAPRPVFEALSDLAHEVQVNYPGSYTPLTGVAEWEGDWEFSDLGADVSEEGGERVTFPFWGTDLGLRVRRGGYRGYFFVTIDGQPAPLLPRDSEGRAYLVLTSPDYSPQVTVRRVADDLSPGFHTAEIVAERGWDQWALVGWSVGYRPDASVYRLSLAGLTALALALAAGTVVMGRRMAWRMPSWLASWWGRLSEGAQIALTGLTAVLMWVSAWMTWGLEAGDAFRRMGDGVGIAATLAAAGLFYYSPWFLLTVLAGLVLFVLILLRLDLGLALIVALAPFYTLPRPLLDKAFSMAEIVTLMCLASWGMRRLSEIPKTRGSNLCRRLSNLDWVVLGLVIVASVSPFFARFKRVAWRELRLVILEPAALYLMLRTSRLDRKALWRMVDFFVGGGVAVALIGLVQYGLGVNLITAEGGLSRLRSVYGSPNNVGLYLGRILPLLMAIALFARHRRRRWIYGLAVLPVGAALALSFSKGALLVGIPTSLLVMGFLAGGRWRWITLALVLVGGLAALPLLRLPRFASLLDLREGTTFFRLKLWRATLEMIGDYPWLGVGLDNFLYYYRGRYILFDAWQQPDLSHPHNFVLDHWSRLGIFGLLAGVALQIGFWQRALPLRRLGDPDARALALGLMGAVADMLAHGLVDHSFFLIDLAFAFFLILGLTQALSHGRLKGREE